MGNGIVNALGYKYGLHLQSAEGTAGTVVDLLLAADSGTDFKPVKDVQPFSLTDANNAVPGYYAKTGSWSGTLKCPAFTASTGVLAFALLGTDTKTGSSTPFTHKITKAEPNAQWITVFQSRPDFSTPLWEVFGDGTVDSLEFAITAGEPVMLTATMVGKTYSVGTTAPSETNVITEDVLSNSFTPTGTGVTSGSFAYPASGAVTQPDWFTVQGATLQYTLSGMSPATSHYIESATVKISRATTQIQTDALQPTYRSQGLFDVAFSATVLYSGNYNDYLQSFTGTTGGTALTNTVNVGSVSFTLPSMQGSSHQLVLEVPDSSATGGALALEVTPIPADTKGGPMKLNFVGKYAEPTTGGLVTVSVANDVSSAY